MSLYLGNKLIAGAGTPTLDTRNVGQIVQSAIPLTDAGLHLLDGALLANGSYSAFIAYMASMYVSCPEIFDTESNWQQSVAEYDVCGKFVYDSTNNTVRLPKLLGASRYLIKSEVNGTEWYRIYSDGWCEQGGYLGDTTFSAKTISLPVPYNDTDFTILTSVKNSSGAHNFRFAKNSSSSITFNRVGDSNCTGHWMTLGYTDISSYKVEPLYQYIVIANSTKTEIEVDIDEIAADLNGKADVDLSNVSTTSGLRRLIEVYNNGTSWYKVFNEYNPSTGALIGKWCEQGSFFTGVTGTQTITLAKPFLDTNYSLSLTESYTGTLSDRRAINNANKTTSSFQIFAGSVSAVGIYWEAKGYIA